MRPYCAGAFLVLQHSCISANLLELLYSFFQELAKMQVSDAIIIILGEQRSHGDNVFRIVVLDGTEIAKLPLSGCIVGYDVGSLHVDAFASWFGAYGRYSRL